VGPTAVGKTDTSIHIAKTLNCEILSADSRQFYREMRIGTAKPVGEELQGVRHHFIDCASIREEISAGRYEVAVLDLLEILFRDYDYAVMTGGSGLYIQAVCQGMNDIPPVPAHFREELYKEFGTVGLQPLLEELAVRDPGYYNRIDHSNSQRIIRALEVCRATSQPYSSFREDKKRERDFNIIRVGLERPREELFDRINKRVDQMVEEGLFEEVRALYNFRNLNALKTVGYKEIFDYMDGRCDKNEAIRLVKRNSRRYAKRQMTWFQRDDGIQWFHPDEKDRIVKHIVDEMEG